MNASDHNFFLAFLTGLAIGLVYVFLYGFFCRGVKKYLGCAADFLDQSSEPEGADPLGSAAVPDVDDSFHDGAEMLDKSDDSEASQNLANNKSSNQGIKVLQRILLFAALCRMAVTAFLAWLAICACSMPAIPVAVGFTVASGSGLIKLARTSAEDK